MGRHTFELVDDALHEVVVALHVVPDLALERQHAVADLQDDEAVAVVQLLGTEWVRPKSRQGRMALALPNR